MPAEVPLTPLAKRYADLHRKRRSKSEPGDHERRLEMATELLANPKQLVKEFHRSVVEADRFFTEHHHRDDGFYEKGRNLRRDIKPGLTSTAALGRWFEQNRGRRWQVLGDDGLSFHYLDRELVSTRAPGERLAGGRSTRLGPRIDLLLADARNRPIVGEVKLTVGNRPDKDPFYALIQALASAAYLLPENQLVRLKNERHDPDGRLDLDDGRLALYVLVGDEPEAAGYWFELRECAARLSALVLPDISTYIRTIAGLDLTWFKQRPTGTRLRIIKRFAFHAAK
jgi:hypothetical protein